MTIGGKVYVPGADITGAATTYVILGENQNGEEHAEDFNDTNIAQGSWVHCTLVDSGGGKNFTVQLELKPLSEEDEAEE